MLVSANTAMPFMPTLLFDYIGPSPVKSGTDHLISMSRSFLKDENTQFNFLIPFAG